MVLGSAADVLLGDPRRGHPVAVFGRAAAALERRVWRDDRAAGACYAMLCAGGVLLTAATLSRAAHATARSTKDATAAPAPVALAALTTWTVLGGTGLTREARAVAAALERGDTRRARELLPRLCGRDPRALEADALTRAVVESVAENTSDAVVGALVWATLAGVPGMAAFRAVNTLDAMVGHRSPRYARFGWAAARLDDVAGWPGARLTAALAVVAGPAGGGALRAWRRDGHRHPSPNAGPVEAAFAGALGLRLGGTVRYGERVEHRPVLHAVGRPVAVRDIERAVRLSRRVGLLALVLTAGARLAAARWANRRMSRGTNRGEGSR